MGFGDGIASVCQSIEDKHGRFWANCTFVAIVGSAMVAGATFAWISCEHIEWEVGREFPNQAPCSEAHVCDTFHGFLAHQLRKEWTEDIKKW